MSTTRDPLIGTWVLNPSRSEFDVNHRPHRATMIIGRDDEGRYTVTAEGTSETGRSVTERPQTLIPDGQSRPVPDFPGLTTNTARPDPQTLHTEVKREDGSIAGRATYTVSTDGRSLSAVTAGFDSQLREFTQRTVWDRQ
jgi:hypothetical protein